MSDITTEISSKIPKIYFWRPWFPPGTYYNAVKGIFATDMRKIMRDMEQRLEVYLGSRHVILMPSGTVAIFSALQALLPKDGGEVLLPSLVCENVPYAVRAAGKTPSFLEINPETFNIDEEMIENTITKYTQAIIAVHLFGNPCGMAKIIAIARKHNILLIEDAAQALGAEYEGKKVGTLADVGILSFNNKVIDGGGGGAIVTDSANIAGKIRQYRDNHFTFKRRGCVKQLLRAWLVSEHPAWAVAISKIYRSNSLKAGIATEINVITPLILQNVLPVLDYIIQRRRDNFILYEKYMETCNFHAPSLTEGATALFYNITLNEKDAGSRNIIQRRLREKGISTIIGASGTHRMFGSNADLPVTNSLSQRVISFPTDPHLEETEIQYIANTLKEILSERD